MPKKTRDLQSNRTNPIRSEKKEGSKSVLGAIKNAFSWIFSSSKQGDEKENAQEEKTTRNIFDTIQQEERSF